MSLAELREQAVALSAEERLQLAAFLAELDERTEIQFRETADRRMKAMDTGKKVTMEEFEREHARKLTKENRCRTATN
jgi:hypothetical protein